MSPDPPELRCRLMHPDPDELCVTKRSMVMSNKTNHTHCNALCMDPFKKAGEVGLKLCRINPANGQAEIKHTHLVCCSRLHSVARGQRKALRPCSLAYLMLREEGIVDGAAEAAVLWEGRTSGEKAKKRGSK